MDFRVALGIKDYFVDREMRREARAQIAAMHRSRQIYQRKVDEQVAKIRSMHFHASQSRTVRRDDATRHAGDTRTPRVLEPVSIVGRSI